MNKKKTPGYMRIRPPDHRLVKDLAHHTGFYMLDVVHYLLKYLMWDTMKSKAENKSMAEMLLILEDPTKAMAETLLEAIKENEGK